MRLLLWTALTCALAVEGAMFLPLLAGLVIVGCAAERPTRHRGPRHARR
ncbi:hypothetical protein ACFFSW_05385 [Saccharothrix longispora]|uniref:Uncharacterized protein n=1 Tax=Saccharothrix longispora TaxID=33920 RepID=A0ABU1PRB5_9PSEU|nr:hypothetical protein [Saccharothrix longispora]MDR6593182.1 hypothetical protein [Saccharothrix longispora]